MELQHKHDIPFTHVTYICIRLWWPIVRNWLDSVLNYSYIFQTPSIKINHIMYKNYLTLENSDLNININFHQWKLFYKILHLSSKIIYIWSNVISGIGICILLILLWYITSSLLIDLPLWEASSQLQTVYNYYWCCRL